MIDRARGTGRGQKFLHVGVSEDFMRLVHVEAAQASLSVKDFIIAAVLRTSSIQSASRKAKK